MEQIDVDMGSIESISLSDMTMTMTTDDDNCDPQSAEIVDLSKPKNCENVVAKAKTRDEEILRKLSAFAICLIHGAT